MCSGIRRLARAPSVPAIALVAVALGACGGDSPTELDLGTCSAEVDLFPVPVTSTTSLFSSIDDGFLVVVFDPAFQFSFFGTSYTSVFLNTNGGMTFGGGDNEFDLAATDVTSPGIAVFWGDLDAAGTTASEQRAAQMTYESCTDRFIVRYRQLQDHDIDTWDNTATVTLGADGKIVIEYGTVLTEDLLVGVFDGTHTNDQYVTVQNSYSGYSANGTGTILFDSHGLGPDHMGELTSQTITFNP